MKKIIILYVFATFFGHASEGKLGILSENRGILGALHDIKQIARTYGFADIFIAGKLKTGIPLMQKVFDQQALLIPLINGKEDKEVIQRFAQEKGIDSHFTYLRPPLINNDEVLNKTIAHRFIKNLSAKYGVPEEAVVSMLRPIKIMKTIFHTQKDLLDWQREDILDVLNEAKKQNACLNFTYKDPLKNNSSIITPLFQFAKKKIYAFGYVNNEYLMQLNLHYMKIGQWFVNNGAALNKLDETKSNALMIGINHDNHFLVWLLAQHDEINIDQQNTEGATALYLLTTKALQSVDESWQDSEGIYIFATEMMQRLISRGANPFLKAKINDYILSGDSRTPKQYLEYRCNGEYTDKTQTILDILIKAEENWSAKLN